MKKGFGDTLKQFKHFYIDMPGFGKSSNEYILTTKEYSQIIELFLETLEYILHNITIAGHSFGGKVATLTCIPKILYFTQFSWNFRRKIS
jgi:pimeloyl-ACP methyl ester carboxylesterase